ncbi:MAG TPA: MarR family transcriptional regulator [Streptosporangiaceae bacterium]|nr:MarR family transcriptional regulator [Streptosporangiaceae bacterium]
MRAARGAYARSIRVQLQAIGVDDLPRNGAFILTGIDAADGPRPDLTAALGVTKQAVSQVTETLVSRGYLERSPDPEDRRRVALELTERGRLVVEAVARGVAAVDLQLRERVPAEQVGAMRAALRALGETKAASETAGPGRRPDRRQLRSFSPIFPVRDVAAALAHYSALGFTTHAYTGGGEYGFANRDGTGLHLAADAGHDPGRGSAAYLYVRDADALHAQWSRPGIGGHTHPVGPTPYGLREGSHVDPDGNLIRFGSPMQE